MSERRKYRAGDVVRHIDLGEEWLLACDEWADRVCACGWPPSWNQATEVELVTPATDEERLARLRETAAMGCSVRSAQAQASLDAEPKPRRALADVVADPPDGWRVTMVDTYETTLSHSATHSQVSLHGPLNRAPWVSSVQAYVPQAFKYRARVAGHRAVAELLEALAEVSGE